MKTRKGNKSRNMAGEQVDAGTFATIMPVKPALYFAPKGIPTSLQRFGAQIRPLIPPVLHGVMTTRGSLALSTANPGYSDNIFKLNSILTPFPSGGYEPQWFDEMAAMYTSFRVLSSSISIEAHPVGSVSYTIVVAPSNSGSAIADIWSAGERQFAKQVLCVEGSNKGIAEITNFVNVKTIQPADAGPDGDGTFIADPGNLSYWHVAVAPDVAGATDIKLYVKLMHEVVFLDVKPSAS